MSRQHLRACGFSPFLLLAAGGIALAQGEEYDPPFTPSNEQVDRELDESLAREYDAEGRPIEPGPSVPGERRGPPPPPPPEDRDDEWKITLGGLAAHYHTWLREARIAHREGGSGGGRVDLISQQGAGLDFDAEHSQTYRTWVDFGSWISLEGGYRHTVHRANEASASTFTFGRQTFNAGSLIETKLDLATIDVDFVFKPVNNRWFELALHFGARYVYADVDVARSGDVVGTRERQRIEAAMPVIGLGIAFRPVRGFELFARGRIGHFGYERDGAYVFDDDDGDIDYIAPKEKSATSGELDVGMQVVLFDTIGVIGGWRLDYIDLKREVTQRSEKLKAISHGLYAGMILQF